MRFHVHQIYYKIYNRGRLCPLRDSQSSRMSWERHHSMDILVYG